MEGTVPYAVADVGDETFSFTWGLPILEKLGYTRLFNFMVDYYIGLGLTRHEMLCLIHLARYHYETPKGKSCPSMATVAANMGYKTKREVMRLVADLEHKGMIEVTRRKGQTSIYNASGFAKAAYAMMLAEVAGVGSVLQDTGALQDTGGVSCRTPEHTNTYQQKQESVQTPTTKTGGNNHDQQPTNTTTPGTCSAGDDEVLPRGGCTPKILTGTGDSQTDAVATIGAGASATQAKELVARAMYRLMWPTLDWPEGKGKINSDARAQAVRSAERVLARIGQERYNEALDACHLLLTNPTEDEGKWLYKCQSVYGLVDAVTKRVDGLRASVANAVVDVEATAERVRKRIEQDEEGKPKRLLAMASRTYHPGLEQWIMACNVTFQNSTFTLVASEDATFWLKRMSKYLDQAAQDAGGEGATWQLSEQ